MATARPVTQFLQPYTLMVNYTEAQLDFYGVNESTLNLAFHNGSAWDDLLPCHGCSLDTANNRVTVKLDHFTEFALTGQARNGPGSSLTFHTLKF